MPHPEPPYPPELAAPIAGWIFDYGLSVVWLIAFVVIAVAAVRRRAIPVAGLLLVSATTMFWQEWFADWGARLVYNRELLLFGDWTSTWLQTYWKPVGVVPGYGVFFLVSGLLTIRFVGWCLRTWERTDRRVVIAAAGAVSFLAYDYVAEGIMTSLGWYTYTDPVPPSIGRHGSMSFVFPALPFLVFGVAESFLLMSRDRDGWFAHERALGAARLRAGPLRESARLGAWIVTLNGLLFVTQPLLDGVVRVLFLGPTPYVP